MENEFRNTDWLFLLACLFLGVIAEESFFQNVEIGVSYLVFVSAFYSVFYLRFRRFSFSNQRLGWLILICIWLLSLSYFTHYSIFFYILNILVVPMLVMFQLFLITCPHQMRWNRPPFLIYGFSKLLEAIKYNGRFIADFSQSTKKGITQTRMLILRKIMIGLFLSVPVLALVLTLLMSADSKFKQLISELPNWSNIFNTELITRIIIILIITALFFGILQVLQKKQIKMVDETVKVVYQIDGIIALSFLAVLNLVYLLFTFVQFKYFLGGTLQGDFTFAEYARKGFFELLFVSVINLSVLTVIITFVKQSGITLKRLIQMMLTILVLTSAVILCSAFIRLGMYEEAYGYTFTRMLAHSFMIFLAIIFAYTLIQIWISKLSLGHFLFITSLVYYTMINTIDLDQIVVKKNIQRYEEDGKVDIQYMNTLSYTGILGLISLYELNPNIPNLKSSLKQRQIQFHPIEDSWQSYNLKKQQAENALNKLNLN